MGANHGESIFDIVPIHPVGKGEFGNHLQGNGTSWTKKIGSKGGLDD